MAKLIWNDIHQWLDGNGNPLSGALLFTYKAGTSTKEQTYQDSGSAVAHANPIVLNASGRLPAGVWGTDNQSYKIILAPSGDTDPPSSPVWSLDNVLGINDQSVLDQWKASGLTPTYVSSTSFTLAGDQTVAFHIGRRLKVTDGGGTKYCRITNSVFGAVTTVTVDGDALATPTTAVSYGLLTNTNNSIPGFKAVDGYVPQAVGTGMHFLPPALGYNLVGGYLDWTVAGNVLTIAVKTWAGNDPSATEPVFIPFRSDTASTGSLTYRKLTTATSIAINDTALLGTVNGTAFRLWCVAFDDGGTIRLAIINCLSTSAGAGAGRDVTAIYPLAGWGIASATLEDNASDSAQVFYSSAAAVAAKPYATLGFATWESGLAVAGTWSATPTRVQLFGPGVPLPGQMIQTQRTDTGAVATGTTTLPADDTIPQNTEGDQYMSQSITPTSAANMLRTTTNIVVDTSAAGASNIGLALFRDATANALKAQNYVVSAAGFRRTLSLVDMRLAESSAATTIKVRAGGSVGTLTVNGTSGTRLFGGVMNSFLEVQELMA